jgi:drug/metabolite transporter (DMT)-like permease
MKHLAPIFVISAASLWGIDGVVLRPVLYNLPVPLVVLIESSIVAIILSPIFIKRFKDLKKLKKVDWLAFALVGLLGGAIGTMAITKALFYVNYVDLSVVILIQKLQPVFALALAGVLLKERLPKMFFGWAAAAVLGAYLMTFGFELPDFRTGEKTIFAALLSLVACVSFSSSTVFSKRALQNVDFEMGTYLRFLISAAIMLIIAASLNDIKSVTAVSFTQWLIFLLIAFTTGGAAIFLYYYGLKRISASVATICELAFPFAAVLLDYIIRGTVLSLVQWLGIILLLSSILKVSDITLAKSAKTQE